MTTFLCSTMAAGYLPVAVVAVVALQLSSGGLSPAPFGHLLRIAGEHR